MKKEKLLKKLGSKGSIITLIIGALISALALITYGLTVDNPNHWWVWTLNGILLAIAIGGFIFYSYKKNGSQVDTDLAKKWGYQGIATFATSFGLTMVITASIFANSFGAMPLDVGVKAWSVIIGGDTMLIPLIMSIATVIMWIMSCAYHLIRYGKLTWDVGGSIFIGLGFTTMVNIFTNYTPMGSAWIFAQPLEEYWALKENQSLMWFMGIGGLLILGSGAALDTKIKLLLGPFDVVVNCIRDYFNNSYKAARRIWELSLMTFSLIPFLIVTQNPAYTDGSYGIIFPDNGEVGAYLGFNTLITMTIYPIYVHYGRIAWDKTLCLEDYYNPFKSQQDIY